LPTKRTYTTIRIRQGLKTQISWKLLQTLDRVFNDTKYWGYTPITIPPFFKDAGRGKKRIWGDDTETPQPMIINWPGLNDKEKAELIPALSITDNWILLTHPLGTRNKSQPPFGESQRINVFGKHCECNAHKFTHLKRLPPLGSHLLQLSHCVLTHHEGQQKKFCNNRRESNYQHPSWPTSL